MPTIILTRFLFFLFYVSSAIPLFIISKYALGKSHLVLLVVPIYLFFNYPYSRIAFGADWHTLMNFFGLLSIVFFLKSRYVLTGLFSSLAMLSWVPGIVFFIAISLTTISFPDDKIRKKLSKIVLCFLFPILLLVLYAHINGSLSDFIKQTILYGKSNIKVGSLEGITRVPRIIARNYRGNIPIIILGFLGFILALVQRITGRYKKFGSKAHFLVLSILIMTIIYSIVDFQIGDDFIPFIPWLAFYAVFFVAFFTGIRKSMRKSLTVNIVLICFILGLIGYSLKGTIRNPPFLTLRNQKTIILNTLKRFNLREDDSLLSIGSLAPLLFINKKNVVKQWRIDTGWIYHRTEKYEEGGFDAVLHSIDERKPKLICLPKRFLPSISSKPRYRKLKELLKTAYGKSEFEIGKHARAIRLVIYVRK